MEVAHLPYHCLLPLLPDLVEPRKAAVNAWTELALGALGQFTFFAQDSFSLKFPRILYKTYGWRFNAFFLTLAVFVDLGLQQKFKFTTVPIILDHH